ncbi:MAG: alpha-L-arabinofuranosidase [Desulfovibrionaceae bacterium]|nr:alpha-L-arabinofuranosidase [Desulfovibrionaceae bacterium]
MTRFACTPAAWWGRMFLVAACFACFAVCAPAAPAAPPVPGVARLSVDPGTALRADDPARIRRLTGINLNYLLDDDANRPGARPLAETLRAMGAGTLRYPGGAKSDVTFWSAPPYAGPHPNLARRGPQEWPSNDARVYDPGKDAYVANPLDFDEFMALCRSVPAEPVLVVAHDAAFRPPTPGGAVPVREDLLAAAVAWVRYANLEKKYGVKYFEIGNESYLDTYDGGCRAEDYARDLVLFSRAMKAVDPSIQIGANGPVLRDAVGAYDEKAGSFAPWWKTVFEIAGNDIDFVSVHEYPCLQWFGYDYYRTNPVRMDGVAQIDAAARDFGPPGLAGRLRYLLTEINSADWHGHPRNDGWKHENSLGHALVLLDMLWQGVCDPRVDTVQIWATRWMENAVRPELWDGLDAGNQPLPTGTALSLVAGRLGDGPVATSGPGDVPVFAAVDRRAGRLTVFCLNKDTAREIELSVAGLHDARADRLVWRGKGPDDLSPVLAPGGAVRFSGGRARVRLPAVSLTVLDIPWPPRRGFERAGGDAAPSAGS